MGHDTGHRALVGLLFGLSLLFVPGHVLAQLRDVPGSKDHPMIKRFEGSVIIGYEFKKFNDLVLLLGPVKGKYSPFAKFEYEMERDKSPLAPTKTQTVEGQSTRLLYVAPPERSTLEVLRNYERELQKNGFEVLFKCSREQCTEQDGALGWLYLYPPKRRLLNIPQPKNKNKFESVSWSALSYATDQHFLSAKRTSPGGDTYVSVYSARGGYNDHKETFDHPILLLEVIEAVPMENKMVTIDAAAMAKEVAATGHIALYGILFDTDKTDIKPESVTALDEIAKFLKADSRVGVYIVGHTDNVGGFEHNMSLSLRRAEAVVKELTTKYGIPAARLKAIGTGPVVPLAPNDTEEGRAKNRRVELVKQ
jgi:outer membrane protein OmpA-like peptidoglycan-associated protein